MTLRSATDGDRDAIFARRVRGFAAPGRHQAVFLADPDRTGALLLHALADLQLAGGRDPMLGVEAENEAALSLYRSVDLKVEREWGIYLQPSREG